MVASPDADFQVFLSRLEHHGRAVFRQADFPRSGTFNDTTTELLCLYPDADDCFRVGDGLEGILRPHVLCQLVIGLYATRMKASQQHSTPQ